MIRIGLFITLLTCLVSTTGCTTYQAETIILDRPVVVASEWVTLRFPRPLDARPDWEQELLASVTSRYEQNTQGLFGMKMLDGAVIWPDIQAESESGGWLSLSGKGFYGEELSFSDRSLSGNGKRYVAVR